MQKSNSDPIEREINGEPEWSVIWLHGLGADGNDFLPIISELNLNSDIGVRFIFSACTIQAHYYKWRNDYAGLVRHHEFR